MQVAASRFIAQFQAILFDMNGTFMFGHDRFGPGEDYFATYQRIGGSRLSRDAVQATMKRCIDGVMSTYNTPSRYEDFPTLFEAFSAYGGAADEDLADFEAVFAAHELGQIPDANRAFLREIAKTHWMGVVSNLCSHPQVWMSKSPHVDVFRLFQTLVFSSEGRPIKPSPAIFHRALSTVPAGRRVLFVGDSLERDVIPAKALGLGTVWIAPAGSAHPDADLVIESLPELANR